MLVKSNAAAAAAAATAAAAAAIIPMVDDTRWDHSCCALKLVKLAAGTFEAEQVLGIAAADQEQSQPSWTISGSPPTASDNGRSISALLLARIQHPIVESRRSVRAFGILRV